MSAPPEKSATLIYGVDDVPPPGETAVLGLQHYLTMFGSTVAIPLMMAGPLGISGEPEKIGWLIGTMFFVSGIATLLQTTIGNRLPIVQGGTFSFLAPAIAICAMVPVLDPEAVPVLTVDGQPAFEVRMQLIQGAVIIGGVVQMLVGYSGLIGRLLKFVGPVTIAPTIALIGLALYPFGAPTAGKHWGIGGLTIVLVILFSQVLRKKHRAFELFPILLGMGGAWLTAIVLTKAGVFPGAVLNDAGEVVTAAHPAHTSFDKVADAAWFHFPLPFQWGMPAFSAAAIVGMFAGVAASIVESVGDYYACARLAGAPVPTPKVVSRGIGTEGLGGLIAGIIGSGNGTTSYSENIGAIGLTRVGSRRVVQAGALIMLGLGVTAKFGALFATIPDPVVGGMYCTLFGMIVAVGLSNLQFVDMNAPRNLFIIGFAFFMGLSLPYYLDSYLAPFIAAGTHPFGDAHWGVKALADIGFTLGKTGMAVGAVIAVVLDNIVPGTREERGLTHWGAASEEALAGPGATAEAVVQHEDKEDSERPAADSADSSESE